MVEPKGGKSEELKVFEHMFLSSCRTKRSQKRAAQLQERSAAAAMRKERVFGGGIMNDHGSNQEGLGQLAQKFPSGTQIGVPICFTECPQPSLLAAELWIPCCPLRLSVGRKNPSKQGLTHTHTHTHTHAADQQFS